MGWEMMLLYGLGSFLGGLFGGGTYRVTAEAKTRHRMHALEADVEGLNDKITRRHAREANDKSLSARSKKQTEDDELDEFIKANLPAMASGGQPPQAPPLPGRGAKGLHPGFRK